MPETCNPRVTPWEIPELDFYTLVPLEERVKFLLRSAVRAHAYLNQPVEVPELRESLRSLLGLADGGWPQLLLRIGYAAPRKSAMPRRPLDDSLIEEEPA